MTLLASALLGCGKGEEEVAEPDAPAPDAIPAESFTESGLKWREAATLPAVGEHKPADDGKIEIAGPEGWHTFPSDAKYLARFSEKADKRPPIISVFAGDSPLPILGDMRDDTESLEKFREVLEGELKKFPNPRIKEACKPLQLGDTVFMRHVRLRSGAGETLVVQELQTVQGGRRYTVELIAGAEGSDYADALLAHRDQAYAVAANLKFAKAGAAAAPAPPAESPEKKAP